MPIYGLFGGRLLGSIISAGRVAGKVQFLEGVQHLAFANYKKSILSAFREVEDGLIATKKSNERQVPQAQRVDALKNYMRLSRTRYNEGYTSYLELLDALRQYYEGQIELL